MAIKVKLSTGVLNVLTTDTVIHTVAGKISVDALNCFNSSIDDVTIDFFISPDLTSISGEWVSSETIKAGEELDMNALVEQGYTDGLSIVALAHSTGINSSMTYTQYTGADI